jgi:hypothetical protein
MRKIVEMNRSNVVFRETTKEDMLSFFNLETLPFTVKALTFLLDGDIIAISGVRYSGGGFLAFSDIKEGVSLNKITIYRGALEVMKMLKSLNLPLEACPKDFHTAPKFLTKLGFTQNSTGEVFYYG